LSGLKALGTNYLWEELESIADVSGLSMEDVVMLQLVGQGSADGHMGPAAHEAAPWQILEAMALCTTVVVDAVDGTPLHIRTMDWGMDELLSPLTLQIEFRRNNETVYRAVTWAVSVWPRLASVS
jgi:uncharacterized protein with LGFP repeats